MFTGFNMDAKLHKSRHGGQNARGEVNVGIEAYNIGYEISAYRAQYSYSGTFGYREASERNQGFANIGIPPPILTITNINLITPQLILMIGDYKKGILTPVYKIVP